MGIRLDSFPVPRVAPSAWWKSFGDVANEGSGRNGYGRGGSVESGGRGARSGGRFMLPRLVSHTYIVNLSLPSLLRLPGEKLAKLDSEAWKSWDVFAAFSGFYPTIKPLVREEDSKYIFREQKHDRNSRVETFDQREKLFQRQENVYPCSIISIHFHVRSLFRERHIFSSWIWKEERMFWK